MDAAGVRPDVVRKIASARVGVNARAFRSSTIPGVNGPFSVEIRPSASRFRAT